MKVVITLLYILLIRSDAMRRGDSIMSAKALRGQRRTLVPMWKVSFKPTIVGSNVDGGARRRVCVLDRRTPG